jgi:oligopeptide/dipeptide ABC transporter ATP-binding protein
LSIDLVGARKSAFPVVSGASFEIPRGAIVGLFGESGCGKTTLALGLPGLLDNRLYRVRGQVQLRGRNLLDLGEREMERVRGSEIAFIFQDPALALNPVLRVREQVAEVLRGRRPEGQACAEIEASLRLAGLPASPRIADAYPHQLSGGERQRVLIALALACRPALVIADEPFTALDAPRVAELCALFDDLKRELGTSFLVIDHSPAALARMADYALVMYGGRIVERGSPRQLMESPLHPYTAALMRLLPRSGDAAGAPRPSIPGNPPGLANRPPGCPFEPRCGVRQAACASGFPDERIQEKGRAVRCFKYAC